MTYLILMFHLLSSAVHHLNSRQFCTYFLCALFLFISSLPSEPFRSCFPLSSDRVSSEISAKLRALADQHHRLPAYCEQGSSQATTFSVNGCRPTKLLLDCPFIHQNRRRYLLPPPHPNSSPNSYSSSVARPVRTKHPYRVHQETPLPGASTRPQMSTAVRALSERTAAGLMRLSGSPHSWCRSRTQIRPSASTKPTSCVCLCPWL